MTVPISGPLQGVRVIELADEQAEYCGLTLAGLGAEVIKIEPADGSPTRRIGPFLGGSKDPEQSMHFWAYNRGKASVVLDLPGQVDSLVQMLASADVLLDSTPFGQLDSWGLGAQTLRERFGHLIVARMTGFGDDGPWARFRGCDLVHLALGGVVMNCGYDPLPSGEYDLPPMAPQAWHAYHIAGEQLAMGVVAGLLYRARTGRGQIVSCAIHEAVAKATEVDLMSWVMRRALIYRQTGRHAAESRSAPTIVSTKDGRWFTFDIGDERAARKNIAFIGQFIDDPVWLAELDSILPQEDPSAPRLAARHIPGTGQDAEGFRRNSRLMDMLQRFARRYTYETLPWQAAQEAGLMWAPLLKAHENLDLEHWAVRGTFTDIEHPELGRTFAYPTSKWISTATTWVPGRRAPRLNEDSQRLERLVSASPNHPFEQPPMTAPKLSALRKPFALNGVRILDFGWFLASAGGTRFLAALGAESIKVEFHTHPDTRLAAMAPVGGRAAREVATAPLAPVTDPNMGGQFNNKNPGKRGLSLNVTHPRGLEIAKRLVEISDIVAEGFSPGVLEKWGLGYDVLRQLNPRIIVAKQSGMGTQGTYGRFRTVGPIAAALSGLSELSGLPDPAMPAGWGYSYLDWIGAYSFALSMLTALYHRELTGEGQYIDASQTETGIYLTGSALLDWQGNRAEPVRTGNRSPYQAAAPHGIYRCLGTDRWIAIACFTQIDWHRFAGCVEAEWVSDARFATRELRVANQDSLDRLVNAWTQTQEPYRLMHTLQRAGVMAGVCQTAADRCDNDEQLAHLGWLRELDGTKIGRWPVAEVPFKMSETPPYAGGPVNRAAPCYGEDNEYVLGELLGLSSAEIQDLADQGII